MDYTNRHGDTFVFTRNEKGNIEWRGNFEFCRYGWVSDPKVLTMVDPSGGPYITIGTDMRIFGFSRSKVVAIEKRDYGYELIIDNEH